MTWSVPPSAIEYEDAAEPPPGARAFGYNQNTGGSKYTCKGRATVRSIWDRCPSGTVGLDGKNHDLVSQSFGHRKEASAWIESNVGVPKVPATDRSQKTRGGRNQTQASAGLDAETRYIGEIQNVEHIAVDGDAERPLPARVRLVDKDQTERNDPECGPTGLISNAFRYEERVFVKWQKKFVRILPNSRPTQSTGCVVNPLRKRIRPLLQCVL